MHGVHFQPLANTRLVADQASEFGSQSMRQGVGKGGEQHPGIGVSTGQKDGPVQGHDSLAGAGRPRYPCGAAIVPFHPLALRRMQEDGPFLPGIGEGAFQFCDIVHHAEAALGIGVVERIGAGGHGLRDLRLATGGQFQQRLSGLTRQVVSQCQQGVFVRLAHVVQPLDRHAIVQERILSEVLEQARSGWGRLCSLHIGGDEDFLDPLAHLHQLRRASLRVYFQFPTLGPAVGIVMVIDVAQ